MHKHFIWLVCLFSAQMAWGQSTLSYRYWFDGNSSAAIRDDLPATGKFSVPIGNLQGWFHQLHLQVCDSRGLWSCVSTRPFAIMPDAATRFKDGGQYRYWFDGDIKNATIGTMTESIIPLDIPTDTLQGWFHQLHLQVCDSRGLWSCVSTRPFAIMPEASTRFAGGGKYRYWFDGDIKNATTGTMTESIIPLNIPTDTLQGWFHQLHLQVCDSRGLWSSVSTRPFAIMPDAATRFKDGGQYRYWFDGDIKNAKTGTMTESIIPLDIPTDSLQGWFHQLHLQVCDSRGMWSSVSTRPFAIQPYTAGRFKGGQLRYWFDDAISEAITKSMTDNAMTFDVPFGNLSDGDHVMYMQAKDNTGLWTPVRANAFALSSHALSIMSTGGGSVEYEGQRLRDDVLEADIFDNTTVTLTITPDEGYAISSVIVNGTQDVTSQIANNTYTFNIKEASAVVVTFELTDFTKLGDVNNDGRVSVGDLSLTVAYLIGEHPSPFVVRQADANNDSEVNAGDLVRIVDLITGAVERGRHAPRQTVAKQPVANDILSGSIQNETACINLKNETAYTCFQMALTLPEGTDLKDVQLSVLRGNRHTLASGRLDDSRLMVVVYSPEKELLGGNDGTLFTVETATPIEGEIMVDDIVLVTKTGDVRKFMPFTISPATGVIDIQHKISNSRPYDMSGRRIMGKPRRGIYIIDGRKIIFK